MIEIGFIKHDENVFSHEFKSRESVWFFINNICVELCLKSVIL